MENSNLLQLIRSFSPGEQKSAFRFLKSPYFNRRRDIIQLYQVLCKNTIPQKNSIWEQVYPGEPYHDTRFRLLMSYLNRLLETFLLLEADREHDITTKLQLATIYRNRGLMGHYERNMRAVKHKISAQPLRNAWYHRQLRDYHAERHETTMRLNPTGVETLRTLGQHTDVEYLSHRLRLICLEMAQKNVYRSAEENPVHEVVIRLAEREEWKQVPSITTYLAACKMLAFPEDNTRYQTLKVQLLTQQDIFSTEEMRELYRFSINHCIRQTNRGERSLEQEVLFLYQNALQHGYLFENGTLSRFTYHNIVAAALRCHELEWAAHFILHYNGYIDASYRDSSLSFNQARLDYARKRYDSVLLLLQKANYKDPLLHLAAKTLLLKTYFSLQEFDLLQSHLDAMRNYIHRKKVIGYHRTNYLNIIRFTERLLSREPGNRLAQEELRTDIEQEQVLTEKEWLLEQV